MTGITCATAEQLAVQAFEATDPLAGPGWYESSWDLKRGLDVREGLPADVQLNEWIALCEPA